MQESLEIKEVRLGKRELIKTKNKAAILSAARDVFLEKGYDQTGVRDIIRKTNLASGTFYNYFSDKEAIFRSILDEYLVKVSQLVKGERARATRLEEFVGPAYAMLFHSIAQDPVCYKLIHRNEAIVRHLYESDIREIIVKDLLDDIEVAIENGIIPHVDREYLAASFIGIGHEVGLIMLRREPVDPDQATKFATALFVGGINQIPGVTN